jgi:hypothetical protein
MRSLVRLAALTLGLIPVSCLAYVGPGIGLGALLTAIGVALGLLLLVFASVWYPVKKLIRRVAKKKVNPELETSPTSHDSKC